MMNNTKRARRTIVDLEKMVEYNDEGCPACGRKFNLGDSVVFACGAWAGAPKPVHENEAVFDAEASIYVERSCYDAQRRAKVG